MIYRILENFSFMLCAFNILFAVAIGIKALDDDFRKIKTLVGINVTLVGIRLIILALISNHQGNSFFQELTYNTLPLATNLIAVVVGIYAYLVFDSED